MSQAKAPAAPGVESAALRAALQNALGDYYGAPQHITRLDRAASDYRSSFPLEEIDAHLDSGAV